MSYAVTPSSNLVRENFKNLKPAVHGADIYDAAEKTGLNRENIIDFSSSVTPVGPSPKALEALKNSLNQISTYPDSNSTVLRSALANHYGKISKENIIIGNGSTELIYLFAEAFTQKGDIILLPAPSFSEYEAAVKKAGATPKHVTLDSSFHFVPENFIQAMTNKVKAVFLCNPNNPTSVLTTQEDLVTIVKAASAKNILVFLDEDFLEFIDDDEKYSLIGQIKQFSNLFILRSFTKLYGLTGLRVGYGISCADIIHALSNLKIPWNVNCLGQAAAVAALDDKVHLANTLELIRVEKAYLLKELSYFPSLKIFPPDANFLLIDIRKSGFTSSQFKAKMLNYGLLVRDCSSFAGLDEYFIRVAVKTHFENEKLLDAFKKTL